MCCAEEITLEELAGFLDTVNTMELTKGESMRQDNKLRIIAEVGSVWGTGLWAGLVHAITVYVGYSL